MNGTNLAHPPALHHVPASPMELDARALAAGTVLEADVCVVGAGPVGLAMAAELSSGSLTTLVLETGSWRDDPAVQRLADGHNEGDPSAALGTTRARRIGGTSWLWNTPLGAREGLKFVPLDAIDFRGGRGRPPWPFDRGTLTPYYRRAHTVAGLGRFEYDPRAWRMPTAPIGDDHPTLATGLFHFGAADRFTAEIPDQLKRSPRVTLCHSATVTGFCWRGATIEELTAARFDGATLRVRAKHIVLAGGGIENPRLLLVEQHRGHWRDQSGWLGRGYMEHPRDYSLSIRSQSLDLFDRLEFFDARRLDGVTVCGRLAIRGEAVEKLDLPNASVTFLPLAASRRRVHWRVEALARRLGFDLRWPPGFWWSKLDRQRRTFEGFQLLINLEEFPHPDNCITLAGEVDALGIPRPRVMRTWQQDDRQRLDRLRDVIRDGLEGLGLGPIVTGALGPPDPNSHHYLGTTRMAIAPTAGLTEPEVRVFGTSNLYVAGASLFPSGGFANPTLTALALALRLGDKLRAEC